MKVKQIYMEPESVKILVMTGCSILTGSGEEEKSSSANFEDLTDGDDFIW